MSNLDELYRRLEATDRGQPLSLALEPLLREAYESIIARPYDPSRVGASVEALLEFLASPACRTHANCEAVDFFFCLGQDWEGVWDDEPAALADILGDIGGALHDTIKDPAMAANFDATPEQLLARIRAFRRSPRAV